MQAKRIWSAATASILTVVLVVGHSHGSVVGLDLESSVVSDHLIGYYPFDGSGTSPDAPDLAQTFNTGATVNDGQTWEDANNPFGTSSTDGSVVNPTTASGGFTWVPGQQGNALNFANAANESDGRGLRLDNPGDYSSLVSDFTVAAWVKLDDIVGNGRGTLFSTRDGNGFSIWIESNGGGRTEAFLEFANHSGSNVTDDIRDIEFFTDHWRHIAVTVDSASNVTLYIDGVVEETGNTTMNPSNDAAVGVGPDNRQRTLDGSIDELVIFDTPLSEAEIGTLMTIPEPASASMLAACALVLGWRRRRRQ